MDSPESAFAERIDRIAWSDFEIFDADPLEIPSRLLDLVGPDSDAAAKSIGMLEHCLCYDDEIVYEATIEALPFLIESLQWSPLNVRLSTLQLLQKITFASAGFLDHCYEARRLPAGERLAPKVRLPRGEATGVTGALRSAMLEALPELLHVAIL